MKGPLFYAKILLFGEYGVIQNSQGLTLPCDFYKGVLKSSALVQEKEKTSNNSLKNYLIHLKSLELPAGFGLNLVQLEEDICAGMYFDSNIPEGYGVGSSGALVAAIFSKYALENWEAEQIQKQDLSRLREALGLMESYFHGKSSGIDPLICYMKIPILIKGENIDRVGIPRGEEGGGAIFLLDSGLPSNTGSMVEIFFEKLKNEGFRATLKNEFIRYNDLCIQAFLNKENSLFFSHLQSLSRWVLEHFRPMIPSGMVDAWRKGLSSGDYYLKLCGSGGGGYILGFTQNYEQAASQLSGFRKEVIYRF